MPTYTFTFFNPWKQKRSSKIIRGVKLELSMERKTVKDPSEIAEEEKNTEEAM